TARVHHARRPRVGNVSARCSRAPAGSGRAMAHCPTPSHVWPAPFASARSARLVGPPLMEVCHDTRCQSASSGSDVARTRKHWWVLLLRGICAILFGVLTFVWPGITLLTLVLLYGAYALADGVLALAEAVMGGAPAPRWWLALVGLLGIAVGILTFAWP